MFTTVEALLAAAALSFVMALSASLLRSRGWTPAGMWLAMGNRDDLPEPTPLVARADRASKNMLENLLFFVAAVAAAHFAGPPTPTAALGATVFVYARLAYWVVYLAGIKGLRTAIWAVGVGAIATVGASAV